MSGTAPEKSVFLKPSENAAPAFSHTAFEQNFSARMQEVFEQSYLKPMEDDDRYGRYPFNRYMHGAMHASRVASYVPALVNLYRKHGNEDAQALTAEDVTLLKIAAVFHDSARKADGPDLWDKESADNAFKFLVASGVDEKCARLFAGAAEEKDAKGIKNILQKIVHDADSLDVMRTRDSFDVTYLDFHKDIAGKDANAMKDLISLARDIRDLLAHQGDLLSPVAIVQGREVLAEGIKAPGNAIETKAKYELADNVMDKITRDFALFPALNALYNGGKLGNDGKPVAPAAPQGTKMQQSLGR